MDYIVDIIILLCLGWGAYKGFRKGFIKQVFTVLALFFAIWCGFAFADLIVPFLQKHFNLGNQACSIVSFFIVFLLILMLVHISGYIATKIADFLALGLLNRLVGAFFGIIINALILSIIIFFFNQLNDKKRFIKSETLEETYLYKPVEKVAPAFFPERF